VNREYNEEPMQDGARMQRRDFFRLGIAVAGMAGTGVGLPSISTRRVTQQAKQSMA
jgi:hypothetical protein